MISLYISLHAEMVLLPSNHPLILSHRPQAVHTHVCMHTAHGRSQSGREGCSKDMFVLTSWNTPLVSKAWNCLVPSQSPDAESNHPSVLLTHKLLWSGAFALPHICRELLYDSRSLKRHQRNIVVHNRLLFLTIFHGQYYIKPNKKAIW